MKIMAGTVVDAIKNAEDKVYADHHYKFFKAFKGGYGEGDKFYGLKVPLIREIAKTYGKNISLDDLHELMINEYHEVRLCALIILNLFVIKNKGIGAAVDFYLNHLDYINNWDLVDLSAPYILGRFAYENKNSSVLKKLANSGKLWCERISVVSCLYLIKRHEFEDILNFSEKFLSHQHDLMHKACGWMLREVGKADIKVLKEFLNRFYKKMPRTMLRYSIERMSMEDKAFYMKK